VPTYLGMQASSLPTGTGSESADVCRAAAELFTAGHVARARGLLESALPVAADDDQRAEILHDLAVVAVKEDRLADAARLADDALDAVPGHAAASEVLGYVAVLREHAVNARLMALCNERIAQFEGLSTCVRVAGRPQLFQPVLFNGRGRIRLADEVVFGYQPSPGGLSGYGYVEARHQGSTITIASRTIMNNNVVLVAEGDGISIGRECLFGVDVQVIDTDGHDLHPARRRTGQPATAPVTIEDNVFLGNGVRVTKGVTIGADTVVGAGSVVVSSLPAGVIAAGVPARPLRSL
jgi:acetyltransferase-like isoleucine patch superfamily enzyme